MGTRSRCALLALTLALVNGLCAYAPLLPQVTSPPDKPPAPKPAQIVIQTSPNAQVYLTEPPGTVSPRPPRAQGPTPGQVRKNPKDGLKYVWIPPGTFMMGCSPGDNQCQGDENPPHQVTITRGFWMGQTEVTVGAYRKFVGSTGAQMPVAPDFNAGRNNQDMPIVNVSWDDARAFCGWAGGRLPTEAEWEYAARAGSTEARYGLIDEVAWYSNNSGQETHPVGQKRANRFGLYDVLGNVWAWVNDWYDPNYYQNSPSQDPSGPTSGQLRVLRGGSWNNLPRNGRVSDRNGSHPADGNCLIGFRCARESATLDPSGKLENPSSFQTTE